MNNSSPIILDRLKNALAAHGVSLKRNQLLDVAASAYGYRNNNAFSAAAKDKELTAPRADKLGVDDHGLLVLRDPKTGAIFAIDPKAQDAQADRWCLSPYGGIIDVTGLDVQDQVSVTVHTATISHRFGTNFYVANTEDELDDRIIEFCKEYWNEARAQDDNLPEDVADVDNKDIINFYFGAMEDEFLEAGQDTLYVPLAVKEALSIRTTGSWVISCLNNDADEPMLWWNDADGWGDLASATVYADQQAQLPDAGMKGLVSWQKLPASISHEPVNMGTAESEMAANISVWREAPGNMVDAETRTALSSQKIEAVPGVCFSRLIVEHRSDEDRMSGYQRRTVLRTDGHYDESAARTWADQVRETLRRANATIEVSSVEASVIFVDDGDILAANSAQSWLLATRDLLKPVGTRDRITAEFSPEAWFNDHAIEVDPEGDTSIDITYEMLLIGREEACELDSADSDHLRDSVRAPDWIRDWTGPFTITVDDEISESDLFE